MLYALVLAVGRDPLPGAEERFVVAPPTQLPAPTRLAPIPGIETSQVPDTNIGAVATRVTVPVHISDLPESLRNGTAGVATYHTDTGGDFRWYPLDEAIPGQRGGLLITAQAPQGTRLTVTFSARREHARRGYLDRHEFEVDATDTGATPIVELDGAVHAVRFDLPTDVDQAGPLRLQRVDDRQWLPMLHSTAGLKLRSGTELTLQLGSGAYELQDPLAPERAQRFEVPGTPAVTVTAALPPARDGRL
ncbi:MAG: hypothetical protein ACE37K_09525 [Planctomycetota bacterium]